MRKTSKLILVAGALAALAVPSVASASVAVDDNGVGFVGKGDVQTVLGNINDAAMQTLWTSGKMSFTGGKYKMESRDNWSCSNGGTGSQSINSYFGRSLNVTARANGQGKVTNGWDVNGVNANSTGSYLGGERVPAIGQGWATFSCPDGGVFTGFLPHEFINTASFDKLSVTVAPDANVPAGTYALPNTPVL